MRVNFFTGIGILVSSTHVPETNYETTVEGRVIKVQHTYPTRNQGEPRCKTFEIPSCQTVDHSRTPH